MADELDSYGLGLKQGQNRLADYNPSWHDAFLAEQNRLLHALSAVTSHVEHYGSTAVPGLPAKPILDILVGVSPLSRWHECHEPLLALGYDYAADAGVPGHHIFGRGRDRTERTHLVHVVEFDGESWRSNLAFRDALRANRSLRDHYLAIKRAAIEIAPEDRTAYNAQKSEAIARLKAALTP